MRRNDATPVDSQPSVAVIGGGLAGLAAAAALCECGLHVEVFESRRRLGGRAGSYRDGTSDAWIDHCQHVGMACCTNLIDFCRRTGIERYFRRYDTLHFFGPDGRRYDFRGSRRLPAPLHLAPALMGLKYLSLADRIGIGRAMVRLARESPVDSSDRPTIGQWLRQQKQSAAAREQFWEVVLVSALGETLDRASLPAARKVFVDGFMVHRRAYCIDVPTISLHELYDGRVADWLRSRGAAIHLGQAVMQLEQATPAGWRLSFAGEEPQTFDYVVVAVPWRAAAPLLSGSLAAVPQLEQAATFGASPITGVHLWFDREVLDVPHGVLIGRLAQWVFRREFARDEAQADAARQYCQVVISASRTLAGREKREIVEEVVADLASIWPAAREARLLDWKIVTEKEAVFSVTPGLDRFRPSQKTALGTLALAGDWTATGWPATMEGAVRSGHAAAEAILEAAGQPHPLLAPDLPKEWLATRIIQH
jgi:squalene-associated FAD-dependent desaturase